MDLEEAGRLAVLGVNRDARTMLSIGTRAGCYSGLLVRDGRVLDYRPASQNPPAGTRVVDVTDMAIQCYRADLRVSRLYKAMRLGAKSRILATGRVEVASRRGKIRKFASVSIEVPRTDSDVSEIRSRFPGICEVAQCRVPWIGDHSITHVFSPFPGARYVRLNNGELLPHDGGRWDPRLVIVG
jgi:hypothetical protein